MYQDFFEASKPLATGVGESLRDLPIGPPSLTFRQIHQPAELEFDRRYNPAEYEFDLLHSSEAFRPAPTYSDPRRTPIDPRSVSVEGPPSPLPSGP